MVMSLVIAVPSTDTIESPITSNPTVWVTNKTSYVLVSSFWPLKEERGAPAAILSHATANARSDDVAAVDDDDLADCCCC